jgi:pyridoxamine 5'-phosphate oxidase
VLKQLNESEFRFFTYNTSNKSLQLHSNPDCSLLFYWEPLYRQIHVQGFAKKLSKQENEKDFFARSKGARISIHASKTGAQCESRKELEDWYQNFKDKNPDTFAENWEGYIVEPYAMELGWVWF